MSTDAQKRAARHYYYRQQIKQGYVYLITCSNGDTYVGSTINSPAKRLSQHKSNSRCPLYKRHDAQIEVLEKKQAGKSLKDLEREWIEALHPSLNKIMRCTKKHGILYEDMYYPSFKELWEVYSRHITYNAALARYRKYEDLDYALNLSKEPRPPVEEHEASSGIKHSNGRHWHEAGIGDV